MRMRKDKQSTSLY